MDFSDLTRCHSYTIADERLRLRYVALESAIVELVRRHEWTGIGVYRLAAELNADSAVVADELRQAIAHGSLRWCREGGMDLLRPAFS